MAIICDACSSLIKFYNNSGRVSGFGVSNTNYHLCDACFKQVVDYIELQLLKR